MAVLTAEQVRHYEEEGFVLVSGLIAPEVAAAGEAAMWRALNAHPADPATWADLPHAGSYADPALVACWSPQVQAAAAQLAGEPVADPPIRPFAINTFPQPGEWSPHGPHIDHALQKDGYRTFPRPLRVASILYLNAVRPHGGGTVVWPLSHKKIEALAKSDPVRYELMWTLNQDIATLDLGEPLELLGDAGDVLFYHYLCAHSGSRNVADYPRLALVTKW